MARAHSESPSKACRFSMQIFDAGLDARVEFGCWRAGGKPALGFVHAGVFTELRLRSGGNVVRVARRTRSRGGEGHVAGDQE